MRCKSEAASHRLPDAGQEPAVQVRSDFRSTILWQPDVKTDADGTAHRESEVSGLADDLAGHRSRRHRRKSIRHRQHVHANEAATDRPPAGAALLCGRRQVTVSAVINNNTDQPMRVAPSLSAEGLTVSGLVVDGKPVKGEQAPVEVKAEQRSPS